MKPPEATLLVDSIGDHTTLTIVGSLRPQQLMTVLAEWYGSSATLNVLCDLTLADMSLVPSDELKAIVKFAAEQAEGRRGGKTAILAPRDAEFGMARMYEIFADIVAHPVNIRTFRNRDDAVAWLGAEGR